MFRLFLEVVNSMITMRCARVALVLCALAALAMPVRAGEVDKYLPDDAEIVIMVNVKQLTDSSLVKKFALGKLKDAIRSNKEVTALLDAVGFDPLKDLTGISVGLKGISKNSEPKGLAAVHGQFDVAKIEAKAAELIKAQGDKVKVHTEGSRKIYEMKEGDKGSNFLAIVDKTTAVFSQEKQAILDAFAICDGTKKANLKKEISDLVEKADSKNSLWVGLPISTIAKFGAPDPLNIMGKVDSFTTSVAVESDVKFAVTINAKSADDAKAIADMITMTLPQVQAVLKVNPIPPKALAIITDLLNSIQVTSDGSVAKLKGQLSSEAIENGLKD